MDLERLRCVAAQHARLQHRLHVPAGGRATGHRRVDDLYLRVEDLVVRVEVVEGFGLPATGPPREDLQLARSGLVAGWRCHRWSREFAAADGRWRRARR